MNDSKNLKLALDKIDKDFGKGTVVGGGSARSKKEVISTGSLGLDIATGIGGLARGSVVEIMGWESSGKSTICLNVISNAQKSGIRCLLVDGENSFDGKYAKSLGIKLEDLLVVQMDEQGGEQCYNAAERLLRSGEIGVIVFDSQTSLLPKKVIEDPVGTASMGLHARMMSLTVPKFVTLAGEYNCLIIYISQYREKIGVMFGSPITTNGGNALKFYAHMRIEVSKSVQKVEEIAHHNKTKCKVSKNKLAAPFGQAEFDVIFGYGINKDKEVLELAVEKEIIQQSGSWYSYNGDKLGQGTDNVCDLLRQNKELKEELIKQVLTLYNITPVGKEEQRKSK